MHDQGDPDIECGNAAPHHEAERELRELSELFDLAAIPQAETLFERARLFLRMAGNEGTVQEGTARRARTVSVMDVIRMGDVRGHS